ncbi:aspartyl/asparaginyl beta-hydroxylase isoform X6 [Leguminivora glycinivorella]|uniref:aspartyl/asparaginyl beta-hydroxylase isoform X6 n=1 Tax=Leguminivora glycinivorella TaxID=1035111 RepID=UPI00200E1790|nr:aspartyl/asparaginyl beta-hydroxylase isoform X6 [Leguminivora glycinivorella]
MSGDVQPRKRKDKKRKKDDLGVDEPRGTAAALGEGDVFIHSQHDHGTGGHWCAKIIFFSLLFVLIGLIGLIILENRGLSELEANSVQSQYSGVLEGWLEDAPDDDHHDEHTLELKHHDDHDEAEHSEEAGDDEHDDDHDDDEDRGDDDDDDEDENHDDNDDEGNEEELQEDENDDDQGNQDDDEDQDDNDSAEQGLEDNDEDEDLVYRNYYQEDAAEPDDDDDDDDNADDDNDDDDDLKNEDNDEDELLSNEIEQNDENDDGDDDDLKNEDNDEDELLSNEIEQNDENDDGDDENNQSIEQDDDNDDQDENRDNGESNEQNNEDEEEHEEEEEEDQSLEVEKIEKEAPEDEEPIDVELPALPEEDDDDDDDKDQGSVEDAGQDADDGNDDDDGDDVDNDDNGDDNASEPDDDFLEADDDEPPVERITAPSGKPFDEVEDEPSTEKPTDTLEEEEEYEKRQEQLRKEEAEASHKDGGNSLEEGWPGEPADAYWRQHLEDAEREFNQGALMAAADRASSAQLKTSARARWIVAKSLDAAAERKRDNALLGRAIAAYLELLKMNERLSDKKLIEIAERTINRIQFRGTYLSAEPVYRLLIRRFPDEPSHRTNLTVMFLMANRGDLAEEVLKETLKRWPNDRLALAQYGFILKTQHNRLEEALHHLQKALEGDTGPATEPRFYYHLGDTLLLLGRFEEAHEVHKRGAAHGHFLSPAQRSLYNVPRLKGRPWWNIEDTPYIKLARDLEKHWKEILKEGEAAKALYEQEKEGLKERGEWSQLDLFVRGREIDGRCARAPVTCAVVRREVAAAGCRRGQIKFSSMRAGTHVRPHVGPTNCRLRMHLGLSNTKDTFIRVHKETRQWQTGKVFMFDDSFEHEVWHNGTGSRLVLIVDVWHPELTAAERRQLPAI